MADLLILKALFYSMILTLEAVLCYSNYKLNELFTLRLDHNHLDYNKRLAMANTVSSIVKGITAMSCLAALLYIMFGLEGY